MKITRNISFFKKVNNELECEDDDFDLSIKKSSEVETDDEIHVKDHVENKNNFYYIQVWEKMLCA